MPLTTNIFFRFSIFSALSMFVVIPAHAELKINPYPNSSAVRAPVKAEPADLVVSPSSAAQNVVERSMEEEFESLDALVDSMASEQAMEVAPAALSSSAPIPLLRMDDLQKDAPQSGLYVPRRVVEKPVEIIFEAPELVEPSAAAPSRSLFASTTSWQERPVRLVEMATDAPVSLPVEYTPPSEALLEQPSSFVPVVDEVVEPAVRSENWNTFAGANVRETLDVWSKNAGVELIWASRDSEFDVRSTITLDTTYEAAVQALLEQYDDARIRPVGSLHVDQASGKRTLLIEIADEG